MSQCYIVRRAIAVVYVRSIYIGVMTIEAKEKDRCVSRSSAWAINRSSVMITSPRDFDYLGHQVLDQSLNLARLGVILIT